MTESSGMGFGGALTCLKRGDRVTRRGWSGKGRCIGLQEPDGNSVSTLPFFWLRTAEGDLRVPWVATSTDLLADDWEVVE